MTTLSIGPLTGIITTSDGSTGTLTIPAQIVTLIPPLVASLAVPTGYTSAQLLWDEKFTSLDTTKWNPWLGDVLYGRWSNQSFFVSPLSGNNSGGFNAEYYDPAQLSFSVNGLLITAKPTKLYPAYSWVSGAMTTAGKWRFPAGKTVYVQFLAKMPDMNYGAWPAFWFLNGGSNNNTAEYDLFEGGFSAPIVNQSVTTSTHMIGTTDSRKIDVGVDISKDYNIYAMEYVPGKSLTTFFNGKQISSWTSNIPSGQYCILIDLAMGQNADWRTVSDTVNHPGPFMMSVKEMQVYVK